jgi:hypothetical protein
VGDADQVLKLKPYLAPLFDDPMARTRHYFARLFPSVEMNSRTLRDALIANCGQSSATVNELTLNEVAELLNGLLNLTPKPESPLTESDRLILQVMLEMGADYRKPQSQTAIVKRATTGTETKGMFDNLKALAMVDSKRNVGTWLTDKGIETARHITGE